MTTSSASSPTELPESVRSILPLLWRLHPASLLERLSDGRYHYARHLWAISRHLANRIAEGDARIIVQTPPRHGKSELCAVATPAWIFQAWPHFRVVYASYEQDFATGWGRKVKNVIAEHGAGLGLELDPASKAAGRWDLTAGGGMYCCGIGGPLLGRGFDVAIIDDPVKNAEEAKSPTVRQRNVDWYQTTLRTRAEPGASIILIMQRWDEQDLAGHLLNAAEQGGEPWEVISLPAVAEEGDWLEREPGEALWPERHDLAKLEAMRSATTSYWWAAQYQQRPAPADGGMFSRSMFEPVDTIPLPDCNLVTRIRSWDFAATEASGSADPDYTVGFLLAYRRETGQFWIEDVIRVRMSPGQVESLVLATARQDGKGTRIVIHQDPGQAGKAQIAHYVRRLVGYRVEGYRETGPIDTRAVPFAVQAENGNVRMVRAGWNLAFLDEADTFPNGRHDDQIAAGATAFDILAAGSARIAVPTQAPQRRDTIDADVYGSGDWREDF